MKKEVFSPTLIDVLWGYTLDCDLLNGVSGLAISASEMREHYLDHKASQIAKKQPARGYLTLNDRRLRPQMLE